jgi:hypothetical protein
MEISIFNYSGQPTMLFTSQNLYDKKYIMSSMPNIKELLSNIVSKGWLSSLDNGIYADKIDDLVLSAKRALEPQMEFQEFALAGETSFLKNIFVPPEYLYCVGIRGHKKKLSLTFNSFALRRVIAKYTNPEDLSAAFKIYLGMEGKFLCDSVTPDGEAVCNSPLPRSSRFINQLYAARHSPRIHIVSAPHPVGLDFDTSMIEGTQVTDHVLIQPQELGNEIPQPGSNGHTVTAYLFLSDCSEVGYADDEAQAFAVDSRSSNWPSWLILLALVILIVVIAVIFYFMSRGSDKSPPVASGDLI